MNKKISIENTREIFIGSQKNVNINLQDVLPNLIAEIIFNDVCLDDRGVGPMHLEIIYGHLNKKQMSWIEELVNLKNTLRNQQINLSDLTIEKIQMFRQRRNKKKLKIVDSFENGHQPVSIQITKNCENQILEENQTFTIGFYPQLIVKRIFYKLEYFFQKYSTKKNVSKIEQVFDALQSLQAIVQFSGIDYGLAELFKLVQERNINLYDYNQRFQDDNLMFYNKLQSILDKKCILLNVQRDSNQIENFMLVADQKSKFSLGRMDYSDIQFSSSQVSRAHGQINYIEDKNQWIIQDGMLNSKDEWQYSSFGTWLEMNVHQEYYIDIDQSVKIGNSQLLKFNIENRQNDLNLFEQIDENEYENYQTQKQMDTDKLVEQLLEL